MTPSPHDARREPGTAAASFQLALDLVSLDDAVALTALLGPRVRRVEIGTPLLLSAGLDAVRRVRDAVGAPVIVVADTKICDAGERIARAAFDAGADIVTVVAAAVDDPTWLGVLNAAAGRADAIGTPAIVVDSIARADASAAFPELARTAAELGVPLELCIHRPKADPPPFPELAASARIGGFAALSVAGRLTAPDVPAALAAGFGTLIVGSAISGAGDPLAAWESFLAEA